MEENEPGGGGGVGGGKQKIEEEDRTMNVSEEKNMSITEVDFERFQTQMIESNVMEEDKEDRIKEGKFTRGHKRPFRENDIRENKRKVVCYEEQHSLTKNENLDKEEEKVKIIREEIIRKGEKYIKEQGVFKLELGRNKDEKDREIQRERRFGSRHVGEIIVTATLNKNEATAKRNCNALKIVAIVVKDKVQPKNIRNVSFVKSELTFGNVIIANKCLDLNKNRNKETAKVWYDLQLRHVRCKGIVKDWDMPVRELIEAMGTQNNVVEVERLYIRKWNKESRKMEWIKTKNIKVSFEGNNRPSEIRLFGGLTGVRVFPYVEEVQQCFNCYAFGHVKYQCRSKKKCVICGAAFHGNCDSNASCANCKGNHRANYKGCPKFLENKRIKTMMANENISPFKAKSILREEKEIKNNFDLQMGKWPTIHESFKKEISSEEDRKKKLLSLRIKERDQDQYGEKELEEQPRGNKESKEKFSSPKSGGKKRTNQKRY